MMNPSRRTALRLLSTRTRNWKSSQHGRTPPAPSGGIPPYIWMTAAGTTGLLGYTYWSNLDTVPLTKRTRWIATSPKWEQQLGDQEYRQLLQHFRKDILPPNHPASVTVRRVGSRIAESAREFAQQHQLTAFSSKPFTYTVVRSDMANAFVLPGNHIFVMTGLFKYVHNEDELAAVLGHETAHNLARHAGEKVSGSLVVNMLARLSLLFDPSGVVFTILLPAASVFRELPNSRTQEIEADEIGVHIAARACYDPRAAKRVFDNMKQGMSNSNHGPEFLSTHPSHDKRIVNFDIWMPDAMREYESNDRCRAVRQEMKLARQAAARQAVLREKSRRLNGGTSPPRDFY